MADDVVAKYDATIKPNDPSNAEIDSKIKGLRDQRATFGTILEMELLRLRCVDQPQLALEVVELRDRWRRLGAKPIEERSVANLSRPELLGEATVLTSDIFQHYVARDEFARAKRTIVLYMFVALLVVFSLGLLILWTKDYDIMGAVVFFGALGGYVSAFMRVYQTPIGDDPILSAKLLRSDWASIMARPILGVVFAVILHLLFVGQLLTGGVFPELHVLANGDPLRPAQRFSEFFSGQVHGSQLDPTRDYAKLLVWCFIAGFAERFVPDVLEKLAKEPSRRKSN
jgi:hypothetical protein